MSFFPRFRMMLPVIYRHRHGYDRWPSHFKEMEKFMENFFPAMWRNSSPFYSEYSHPGKCRHQYMEFTEFEERDPARKTQEGKKNKKPEEALDSDIEENDKKFRVSFETKRFKPEEIKVRLAEDQLVVEGVQDVSGNEGYVSRRFVRQYTLPKNIDVGSFKSRFSKDGVLVIEAAKLEQAEPDEKFIEVETEIEGEAESEFENKK